MPHKRHSLSLLLSLFGLCLLISAYPAPARALAQAGCTLGDCVNGQGTYTFAGGERYEGEFLDGKFHGKGKYTFASGKVYTGEFLEGRSSGQGEMRFPNGSWYKGQFKDGKFEGQGEYHYPGGDRYEGQFHADKFEGEGTYYFADGSRHVGLFKDGRVEGKGTMYHADGRKQTGIWKGDKFTYSPTGASADLTDKSPPEITIATEGGYRALKMVVREDVSLVSGTALDPSGVAEVKVNEVRAQLDASGRFQARVELKMGVNQINVRAADTLGNVAMKSFSIVRESALVAAAERRGGVVTAALLKGWYSSQHAIVIGIDRYQSASIDPLVNAVNDAKAVAAMLKKLGFEVTELYDERATRSGILQSFRKITQAAQPNDSFLFYFAGHGQGLTLASRDKVGYIIPYDAKVSLSEANVIEYNMEAIPLNDLRTYAQDTKSKHVALVLDSCFSGLAMKRSIPKLDAVDEEYYSNLLSRRAINILTAGDDQPVSDGSGHSPFTQALLNALDRGNIDLNDRDGLATFTELAVYVKEKVEKATARRQRPQFDNLSQDDGEFVFKVMR